MHILLTGWGSQRSVFGPCTISTMVPISLRQLRYNTDPVTIMTEAALPYSACTRYQSGGWYASFDARYNLLFGGRYHTGKVMISDGHRPCNVHQLNLAFRTSQFTSVGSSTRTVYTGCAETSAVIQRSLRTGVKQTTRTKGCIHRGWRVPCHREPYATLKHIDYLQSRNMPLVNKFCVLVICPRHRLLQILPTLPSERGSPFKSDDPRQCLWWQAVRHIPQSSLL